ncbi:uncharacterized protein KZ484_023356 isoform 4-T4 [Pholidichthys leucotaenia]
MELEVQLCSVIQVLVNSTFSEVNKLFFEHGSSPENTRGQSEQQLIEGLLETGAVTIGAGGVFIIVSSDITMVQFGNFMTSLAQEALEKIYHLVKEFSSELQLQVSQGAVKIEELKRRLEVAETQLALLQECRGGQIGTEVELTEGGRREQEEARRTLSSAAGGKNVLQRGQDSERSHSGQEVAVVDEVPIVLLWNGVSYETSIQTIIREEGPEAVGDQSSPHYEPNQDDADDPDDQCEPEDQEDDDPRHTTRSKHAVKPRSDGVCAKTQKKPSLRCKLCTKTFTTLLHLKVHEAIHRANKEKPFHCSQCGREFSFQQRLNAHMLLHTGGAYRRETFQL